MLLRVMAGARERMPRPPRGSRLEAVLADNSTYDGLWPFDEEGVAVDQALVCRAFVVLLAQRLRRGTGAPRLVILLTLD